MILAALPDAPNVTAVRVLFNVRPVKLCEAVNEVDLGWKVQLLLPDVVALVKANKPALNTEEVPT